MIFWRLSNSCINIAQSLINLHVARSVSSLEEEGDHLPLEVFFGLVKDLHSDKMPNLPHKLRTQE